MPYGTVFRDVARWQHICCSTRLLISRGNRIRTCLGGFPPPCSTDEPYPHINKAHFSVVPVGTTSVKTPALLYYPLSAPFTRYVFLLQSLSLCPLLFMQQAPVNRAKGNQDLLFVSFKFTRRFFVQTSEMIKSCIGILAYFVCC